MQTPYGSRYKTTTLARMLALSNRTLLNAYVDADSVYSLEGPDVSLKADGSFPVYHHVVSLGMEQKHKHYFNRPPHRHPDDLSAYNLDEFVRMNFRNDITHTFEKCILDLPLLKKTKDTETVPALALWITISRIMGDLPDVKYNPITGQRRCSTALLTNMCNSKGVPLTHLSASYLNSPRDDDEEENNVYETLTSDLADDTGDPKNKNPVKEFFQKTFRNLSDRSMDGQTTLINEEETEPLSERATTDMEKVEFITWTGIRNHNLRDEIYCQLCKQLTDNPSRTSESRGWILMALCVGCFPPTPKFLDYLFSFLKSAPRGMRKYIEGRLQRTLMTSARTQPPNWSEIKAVGRRQPVVVPIELPDGRTTHLAVDSSSTASEMCQHLAEVIGMKDATGFSLFATSFNSNLMYKSRSSPSDVGSKLAFFTNGISASRPGMVTCLGNRGQHVMDALTQIELYNTYALGIAPHKCPWRFHFRRDYFVPSYDPRHDSIATELTFEQVISGVRRQEYTFDQTEHYAELAAQCYYIEHGRDLKPDKLKAILTSVLPPKLWGQRKSRQLLLCAAEAAFKKSYYLRDYVPALKVKQDVVSFAKYGWPLQLCRFYEARLKRGPVAYRDLFMLAVNWTGVYCLNTQDEVMKKLSFREIESFSCIEQESLVCGKLYSHLLTLRNNHGDEYEIITYNGSDICDMLSELQDVTAPASDNSASDMGPGVCWKIYSGAHVHIEETGRSQWENSAIYKTTADAM